MNALTATSISTIDRHNQIAELATGLGGSVCPVCGAAHNPVRAAFKQATRQEPTLFLGYQATCPARCDGPFLLRSYPVDIVSTEPLRIEVQS